MKKILYEFLHVATEEINLHFQIRKVWIQYFGFDDLYSEDQNPVLAAINI